jgi:hypothetical protein
MRFVMIGLAICVYVGNTSAEEEAKPDIDVKDPDRKLTFEFTDTPVTEAVAFLVSLTKQNIILDPEAAAQSKNISLKVNGLSFKDALKKVLDTAGFEPMAGADAIYIVKKGTKPRVFIAPFKPTADWEKEFCKNLERKVSFEFIDTPLGEAIDFLQTLAKVNIIVDSAIDPDRHPPVTLRLVDISIQSALIWIMRLTNCNYVLRDEALFIFKNGAYSDDPPMPVTPAQTEIFAKALGHLSNDDFAVRQSATSEIEKLGRTMEPLIAAAIKQAKDAEVAARLNNILDSFPAANPFVESPEVTKLLESPPFARKVSFEFVDTPLSEALSFVVSLIKQKMSYNPHDGETVSVRLRDMEAANAIRWIARLAGRKLSVENDVLNVGAARKKSRSEAAREHLILVK